MRQTRSKLQSLQQRRRLAQLVADVAKESPLKAGTRPIALFNASARLGHLSLNAAYSLLSSWGVRLEGIPVVHFVCKEGMSRCVLGTNPDDAGQPPPCASCVAQSKRLYAHSETHWFSFDENREMASALEPLELDELMAFEFQDRPLGQIVLPALRWALRRHNIVDDEASRYLYRQYILSAYNVGKKFESFLEEFNPQAVVVFNGIMFPEAMARLVAKEKGIRVISHEVGLRPFSAFFTEGDATAYPMDIPKDFQLSQEQNGQLDNYLEQRFQGKFTMAGIQFWPEMEGLGNEIQAKLDDFEKIIPVFTNVIFDTSQSHANTLFSDMYAWLDDLLPIIRRNQDTLFVIRAHPDEKRPHSRKQSRESVSQWIQQKEVDHLSNVLFIDSGEYLSSYALIQAAHFVLVYNSSIGLEASILGKAVISAGASRYTPYPTVFYPSSREAYLKQVETFLASQNIAHPESMQIEARRVLYYQLYQTALLFDAFLEPHERMGYAKLKSFPLKALKAENSAAIRSVVDGVVRGKAFLV